MTEYFYAKDGKSYGPVTLAALRAMAAEGSLAPDDQVWVADQQAWRPLAAVLEAEAEPLPPPIPPPMKFSDAPEFQPLGPDWQAHEPGPWRRFWARRIDNSTLGLLVYAAFAIPFFATSTDIEATEKLLSNQVFASLFVVLLMVPVHALFIGLTGASLGKLLLGIRILDAEGKPLGFTRGLRRELRVYIQGFALGIPLANLITLWVAYDRLKNQKVTAWDEDLGATAYYRRSETALVVGMIVGFLLVALVVGGALILGKQAK